MSRQHSRSAPGALAERERRLRRRDGRRRAVAGGISLLAHAVVALALLWTRVETPEPPEPPAVTVALYQEAPPTPAPKPAPAAKAKPTPPKPPPKKSQARRTPAPPHVETFAADPGSSLTEGQIAGAASADSGAPGRPCDMARRIQAALRQDPIVRASVLSAAGRPTLVWNGDWLRSQGEDGKGLAAVREAILWEVGFAPPACRAETVRGLVLFTLNTSAGPVRLAVGTADWRWSDMLRPR